MKINAEFEFKDHEERVKMIYESIKGERDNGGDSERSFVDLTLHGDTLHVAMGGDDIIRLRALTNTWLRLVKVADEMVNVVKECDSFIF